MNHKAVARDQSWRREIGRDPHHLARDHCGGAGLCRAFSSAALARDGWGGHFGGGHFGFAASHRAGLAAIGHHPNRISGHAIYGRRSTKAFASGSRGRTIASRYEGAGNRLAKRLPRGDRSAGGGEANRRYPPRGPIPRIGNAPIMPVTVGLLPGAGAGTASITSPAASRSPGNGAAAGGGFGGSGRSGFVAPSAGERRYVPNEVLLDIAAGVSPLQLDAIARRFRLTRLDVHPLRLLKRTIHRWRINDGTSVTAVIHALAQEPRIARAQPNYLFIQSGMGLVQANLAGDPAQYAVAKLHLPEAHRLATGDGVLVAVIDSGIDTGHPDLAGTVAATFDVRGPHENHFHGTAIAGAIAAHGRLLGVAPRVRLLAVRSLDANGQGTSLSIADGIEWSVARGARVLNMSFAAPQDPLLRQHLAAVHARGIVMVAAAGNEGPHSAPLYPAADEHVIAVTATDAEDHLYPLANRGRHIALAAPGVEVLEPAPNDRVQLISGTSIAAAHVSGIVALILERAPMLRPTDVRSILLRSAAKPNLPEGKDDCGAGLADALRAVEWAPAGMQARWEPAHLR